MQKIREDVVTFSTTALNCIMYFDDKKFNVNNILSYRNEKNIYPFKRH